MGVSDQKEVRPLNMLIDHGGVGPRHVVPGEQL
jgi:hypothetical protein